ncbi:MAG: T9SS type A sorting domain-containing protein, partial [bacterium]|nr:T9SS type A sorting domain-containing protein [bacterium]
DINCYLDGNLFSTERRTVNIGTSMVVWEISYSTPWVVDANTHTVSWLLDANHEITEAIETNNDTSLTFTGILPNDPPWIQLTSPVEGDSATNEFLITWEDRDDNDNAEIYLYWDNDTLEYNGNSIPNAYAIPEDDTTDAFLWDVSAMPEGPVWVLAFITDGLLSMWDYSDGPLYIYHPPIPSLEVNTYAINPPIVVPLNGGWFYYNINVHNFGTQAQTFNVWNRLRMPNGAISYPVWGPLTRTLPANANPTRSLQQTIAGNYPGGSYLYISYIGTFPWIVSDSSYFEFFKSSIPEGNRWVEETTCTGDFFDAYASQDNPDVGAQHAAPLPENLAVLGVSPNPFNPTTAIRFDLPQAARVTLEVFDINGRVVGVQHVEPLQAGSHQIQFDGSELPSGIYLYRLTASGSGATPTIATGKMVLLK